MLCGLITLALDAVPSVAAPADGVAARQDARPEAVGAPVDFDIPAQPLRDALKRYAVLTNWPILFQSDMVAGRQSAPVRGRYAPEDALRRMLAGTGLTAERVDDGPVGTFVLAAVPAPVLPQAAASARHGVDFDYGGKLQAHIRDALCADPSTAIDDYRALFRFQVDAAGHVRQPYLLESTGNARRDAALVRVLGQVSVERPPADLPQPLTMLVAPGAAGDADGEQHCGRQGVVQ
jgi:hypothetical protein